MITSEGESVLWPLRQGNGAGTNVALPGSFVLWAGRLQGTHVAPSSRQQAPGQTRPHPTPRALGLLMSCCSILTSTDEFNWNGGKVGGLFCPWVQIVFSSPVLSEIDFIFWSQSDICIFFLSTLSNWTRMTCIIGHFKTPIRRMHYVLTWRVPAHVISKHRKPKLFVLKKKQFVFDSIQFNTQILSTNYVQAKQYFW